MLVFIGQSLTVKFTNILEDHQTIHKDCFLICLFLDDMISEGKNLRGSVCLLHNISITSVVKHGGHGCYNGEEYGGEVVLGNME